MFAHTLPPRPGHATQQIKTIIPEVVSAPHPLPVQVPEAAAQEEGRQGGRRRRQEGVDQSGVGSQEILPPRDLSPGGVVSQFWR